jgi:hypothetical protein
MQKNAALLCASMILMLIAAPQAFAQDGDESDGGHVHHGTMTGPDGDSMDVIYEMSHTDDGVAGQFVVVAPDGQEYRLEMHDLSVSKEMVTYYWTPPGGDLMISCELASDDEGGWAGDCTDNEDGETGQMSMGPMMDHDMDHDEGHDDHEDHDDDYDADEDEDGDDH